MTGLDGTMSPLPIAPAGGPLAGGDRTADARAWEKKLCAAVVLVYLIAFALPVFDDTGILANHLGVQPHGAVYGWQAFLVGWFVQRIGWFANIAIWIGMILLARRKPLAAALAGVLGLGLGSTYLNLLADHSLLSPQSFSAGYFCWLASAVLLAGGGLGLRGHRRPVGGRAVDHRHDRPAFRSGTHRYAPRRRRRCAPRRRQETRTRP
jgi:hypothetical protein